MYELILLILGLIGLVFGAKLVIKGALNLAEHFKISKLFIGLTILAVGTDLPELFVDITGAAMKLKGIETSGLIVGETIGTCFGQIALTLGILGLFGTLFLRKRELLRDGLMMVGSVALLFLAGIDGVITRAEGIMFMLVYIIYFLFLIREEKTYEKKRAPAMHLTRDIIWLIAGFGILTIASHLTVNNAVILAESLGIAQSLIGILVIGLGTSLPELAVSLSALRKKEIRLSIGNLIGSNIFDILITLGLGSAIAGFNVSKNLLNFDIVFLFITSIIVLLLFSRKKGLVKKEAAILIAIYIAYVILKLKGF